MFAKAYRGYLMLTTPHETHSLVIRESVNFLDYLNQHELFASYQLSSNNSLSFHWADAHETCQFLKQNIKNRGSKYAEYKKLLEHIHDLKMALVWVRSDTKIVQTNLYELYHTMINPLTNNKLNFLQYQACELSLIGPTGPYKTVDLKAWLNREDYLSVVYKNLLSSELPSREFRIRSSGKILCFYGANNINSCVLHVKQIGVSGLLFCTSELNLYGLIKNCENLTLQINTNLFKQYAQAGLEQIFHVFGEQQSGLLFSHYESDRIQVPVSAVKSYLAVEKDSKSHYIFIPYHTIQGEGLSKVLMLKAFAENLKSKILAQI